MERKKADRRLAALGVAAALLICAAFARTAAAATSAGEAFGLALRDHVVRINTVWTDGSAQTGFGFIVGWNEQGAYIATANHVVRGALPGEQAETIAVTYYQNQGEQFPGTLLGTHDSRRDLAVVRAPLPAGFELRDDLMRRAAGYAERGTPVWYVGRSSEWYVPARPGIVNGVDLDERINVEGLNVQVGTSGAPLVVDGGIAGMIVADDPGLTYAIGIDFIERAFVDWAHPWELTRGEPADRPVRTPRAPAEALPARPPAAAEPLGTAPERNWAGRLVLEASRSRACGAVFTTMAIRVTLAGDHLTGLAEGRGLTRVSLPFEAQVPDYRTWSATATGSTNDGDAPWVVLQLSGDLASGTGTWRDPYNSCGGTMTLSRVD